MSDDDLLNERLRSQAGLAMANFTFDPARSGFGSAPAASVQSYAVESRQWQVGANNSFRPVGQTVASLAAGVYAIRVDSGGTYFERRRVICDDLVELPDHATARVIAGLQKFWASADRYRTQHLVYKRGILLWGPQGSGKTATIQFLMRELIALNGIVLLFETPEVTIPALDIIRRVEPSRSIIVVMEDIDEIISGYREHQVLALLDGETQTDNVVYIATTNYPERLGPRILNRPSRFDERIFVGMPSAESRLTYLRSAAQRSTVQFSDKDLRRWCEDTEGLSIAHLRELVAGVLCLDQPYENVLARLKGMAVQPNNEDAFGQLPRPMISFHPAS
jgi:hypothetical protein